MKICDLIEIQTIDTTEQKKVIGGSANGIGALIQVTQLKSQFANEEALHGADKQPIPASRSESSRSIGWFTYSF